MLQLAASTLMLIQGDGPGSGAAPGFEFGGSILERRKLTGDWGGARDDLSSRGIDFDLDFTQFLQGVTRGGEDRGFQYGGKFDYRLRLDGSRGGLWSGGTLVMHAETRYGEDVNSREGMFTLGNLNMAFPKAGEDVTGLTSFKLTQSCSDHLALLAGKFNSLDDFTLEFTGKNGLERFMNSAVTANIISARTIPYSTYGAGFVLSSEQDRSLTVLARDPDGHATTSDLDQLFARGVLLTAVARLPVEPNGLPGHQVFGANWSNRGYTSVDPASYADVPGQGIVAGEESASWALWYNFDQYLWVNHDDADVGWGIFGMTGIADGNPNPVRWNATIGVGVQGLIAGRAHDTLGAGYFRVGISDEFKDLLGGPLAPPGLAQRDEQGVEVFYNAALTAACHLSADVQYVQPSTRELDDIVLVGVRLKVDL